MHFCLEVTVDPTTTIYQPEADNIELTQGIIAEVDIDYSVNVNGSIRCAMFLEGVQIYPALTGKAYRLWTQRLIIRDNLPIFKGEDSFELRAWADGARYPHTIQCFVTVLPFAKMIRKVT